MAPVREKSWKPPTIKTQTEKGKRKKKTIENSTKPAERTAGNNRGFLWPHASERAGLEFLVIRSRRILAAESGCQMGFAASILSTSLVEYVSKRLLMLSGELAKNENVAEIQSDHVLAAIRTDPELESIAKEIIRKGDLPNIHAYLADLISESDDEKEDKKAEGEEPEDIKPDVGSDGGAAEWRWRFYKPEDGKRQAENPEVEKFEAKKIKLELEERKDGESE